MKRLTPVVAIAASLVASAALADPVVWTLDGVTTANGFTVTGSFIYDADTDTYSAINMTSTGGVGPFTALFPGGPSDAQDGYFIQTPAGGGQNGIILSTPSKTNAGGTLTINTGVYGGGLFTCSGTCTGAGLTSGANIATGTLVGTALAPVPTLSEWAMILFSLILAGGASLHIQRRKMIA